jgi:hypothetical protein
MGFDSPRGAAYHPPVREEVPLMHLRVLLLPAVRLLLVLALILLFILLFPTSAGGSKSARYFASYTTSPPTMVIRLRVCRTSASGIFMMSAESTVRSASLPGSMEPLIFSSKAA